MRTGGEGTPGAFPDLAIQTEAYLQATLKAYVERHRQSGIMQLAASGLEEADVEALAAHYAKPAPISDAAASSPPDHGKDSFGRMIVEEGIADDGIPACASCHGDDGSRYEVYPDLTGLGADYLKIQLQLFKAGRRGGTAYSGIMTSIAARLSVEQIAEVSAYYSELSKD